MFDILVEWEDQTVNLCHITDFWITHTILVSKKTEPGGKKGKITKIRSTQEVEILWEGNEKTINLLSELRWENKEEFIGLSLTWASDNSWKGIIREDEVQALSKYYPQKHLKGGIREKAEAEESHDSSSENSEESTETSDEDVCLAEMRTKPNTHNSDEAFSSSQKTQQLATNIRWTTCNEVAREIEYIHKRSSASC